ncbi:MAG TPA: YjbQ family protein [Jiangellaceae bacterium]|nr:YjbQ family protein [Jiangellaceae bacterium]
MDTEIIELRTGTDLVTDVTDAVRRFCSGRGDGVCHAFTPHATAGLALLETGSGTEADLAAALDRILPQQDIYRHRHGSTGHGRDHIVPAFISPSLMLPVIEGEPALGTWQSVALVDTNIDNPTRRLRLSFLAG